MGIKKKSFSAFGDQKKHRKKCQKWSKIEVFLVLGPLKITCIKNEKGSLKIWEKTYKSMLGTFFRRRTEGVLWSFEKWVDFAIKRTGLYSEAHGKLPRRSMLQKTLISYSATLNLQFEH